MRRLRSERLQHTTLRDFTGGLNTVDSDLVMSPKYASVLNNMYRATDGSIAVRPGTELFVTSNDLDEVVNCEFFNDRIVAVGKNGKVITVQNDGTITKIWDGANESPAWSTGIEFISFAQFSNELIICNGVDKPLVVDSSFTCGYLVDKSDGTNDDVPVARYVSTSDRYVVMGGDNSNPSLLYISNQDTAGTWSGDSSSDGVDIDLSRYVHTGSTLIQGLTPFREKLVVFFERAILVIKLGNYDSNDNHVPDIQDVIPQFGAISHRSVAPIGSDLLFADRTGVPSMEEAVFKERLDPEHVSELISSAMQPRLNALSPLTQLDRVFAVYNRTDNQYMLFVPNNDTKADITEYVCFVYTKIDQLNIAAWSVYRNLPYRCACVSDRGRVFLGFENKLYALGEQEETLNSDRLGELDTFKDGTAFTDGTGWEINVAFGSYEVDRADTGLPVRFEWELPWGEFGDRSRAKELRYVAMEAIGRGPFLLQLFLDNNQFDPSTGRTTLDNVDFDTYYSYRDELIPVAELPFVGRAHPGFGSVSFGASQFGDVFNTADERAIYVPSRFMIMKPRIEGWTREPVGIVSMSFSMMFGSMRR